MPTALELWHKRKPCRGLASKGAILFNRDNRDSATKPAHDNSGREYGLGFTIAELLIIVAVLGVLASIAIPWFADYREKAKIARAISDIRNLEQELQKYRLVNDGYPSTLADAGWGHLRDPWGNPYRYLNIADMDGKGKGKDKDKDKEDKEKPRKDRFLVPINTDFDLYSMGRDGDSRAPLRAKASRDDIVRANNGAFVGLASEYEI